MTTKSFKAQVDQAFTSYLKHATAVLQQPQSLKQRMTRVAYIDPGARLRTLVEEAEDSAEFAELSSAMHQALPQQNYSDGMLKTFLRRSRFYLRAFNGEQLSPDELFNRLCSGLFQRSVKTTIMRILVGVNFASRVVDCGAFKIQKFTKDELDVLTEKEINDVFYPFARMDTNILSQYWLLVEEYSSNLGVSNVATDPSTNEPDSAEWFDEWFDEFLSVKLQTPDRAIQLLAIHDWTPDYTEEDLKEMAVGLETIKQNWPGLTVPNRFEFSDDMFFESPHLEELRVGSPDVFDDFTIAIGDGQETKIKAIVEKGSKLLKIVERAKPHWDFVSVAMGYRGKAFLTARSLEQLLWNIAVLDCLLSEKDEVTQSMKRRIGNILGATKQERKDIGTEFGELYAFRSDLVHGNTFSEKVRNRHLLKARLFASRILVWFIDYLLWVDEDFRQREIGYEHYPRREELLYVLDFDRASLNRLNRFIGRLPTSFPKF
jgi:hypothetical protein